MMALSPITRWSFATISPSIVPSRRVDASNVNLPVIFEVRSRYAAESPATASVRIGAALGADGAAIFSGWIGAVVTGAIDTGFGGMDVGPLAGSALTFFSGSLLKSAIAMVSCWQT